MISTADPPEALQRRLRVIADILLRPASSPADRGRALPAGTLLELPRGLDTA